MELVGKVVRKEIEGVGFCSGTVRSRDSSGFFEIVYENGLTETSELAEVTALVVGAEKSQETPVKVKPRSGRRPKKRSRVEKVDEIKRDSSVGGKVELRNEVSVLRNIDLNDALAENPGDSDCFGVDLRGNIDLNCGPEETLGRTCESVTDLNRTVPELSSGFDLSTGLDCNLNEGLDLVNVNVDFEENSSGETKGYIDLNVDAKCDLDYACFGALNAQKREVGFDLNLEVNVENSKDDVCVPMNGNDIVQDVNMAEENGVHDVLDTGEYKEVHVAQVSSAQLLEEIRRQTIVSAQDLSTLNSDGVEEDNHLHEHDAKTVDEHSSEKGNSDEYTSGRRKRRKGSDNPNFTSQPRLRRSARKRLARSPVSSPVTASIADESPSLSDSSLTEEKTTLGGKAENIYVLPPKPQLPPSSQLLNLDGLPILDVFTAYSCLRSFSTLLFLSPFELKDFVEAVRCMSPSLLFDSIHLSVLQLLRKHLKKLAADGDRSASSCLRSLDWDKLDVVTYPLFLVEYLLFSGSNGNPGMDLTRLNFFSNEYFRQPMNLKIEILSRLCDDMTDVEIVRSELNKRSVAAEFEMEFDRKATTEVRRRKRSMVELAGGFSLNEEVVDGSFDRNSDDCCLCKMDGSLLCCDGCPAAYHSKCVGVASNLLPEGDWYCPKCTFDRRVPGWKPEKQIRGAEFIEIDPHGRKYYSSCGYLLVVDTDDSGSNYYHLDDVNLVLEQLKSCSFYSGVISSIRKHWEIPVGLKRTVSGVSSQISVCLDKSDEGMVTLVDGFKAPLAAPQKQSTSSVKKRLDETFINGGSPNHPYTTRRKMADSATRLDTLNTSSEGSAETVQNGLDVQCLRKSAPSSILEVMKEPNLNVHSSSQSSARVNARKAIRPNVQGETGYRNHYMFAQMTTSISEEMMRKSPPHTIDMRSDEEIVSTQIKTILMRTTNFQWRYIQSLYLDAWKEECGWCHSCKNSSETVGSDTNCLFNTSLGALRGISESEVANYQSIDKKSHLLTIICQILSMEYRLQGLLVGPWLNPQHSRIWREQLWNASDILSLKPLLSELEANLHHRVLSQEWLNHVDSDVVMGSAIHILIASARLWSKTAIGKRRGTLLESGVNPIAKKKGGLTMCWWRGGRLSRQLFNWKVLPCSLISKAARQGGSMSIPGILYPENSDSAKRSRRVAWEAAVESSTTSEQLGLQVRTLHSYIKWDDIENSHLLPASDKESKKSARLFKKAIVRRKCTEEETVRYLLDFGKRRNIPDVVLKNGSMVEESSSGRKKFWLNESYVPLHLLKGFEEKKAIRKNNKPGGSYRHSQINKVRKRSSEVKGFQYLFERAERSESSVCEQCKKVVTLSEAANCHLCKRLFHKKHIRRAENEGTYICLQCRSEVQANEQPIVRKRGRPPGSFRKKVGVKIQKQKKVVPKVIPARKSARLKKTTKISMAERISTRLKNHKKVIASKPLRRSSRQPKDVKRLLDESKASGGSKKRKLETKRGRGRPKKVKQEISVRKKRTDRCFSYWLNGLLLSRKPGDERANKFWKDRYYIPGENADSGHDQPKCRLCDSNESESKSAPASTIIACEKCGEWYHGDAYRLNEKNSSMVIGFRCHLCCKRSSPICPHMRSTTSPVAS